MYSRDLTPIAFSNSDCLGVSLRKCASSPEQSVVLKFIIIETNTLFGFDVGVLRSLCTMHIQIETNI